jgi:hypothetical protein
MKKILFAIAAMVLLVVISQSQTGYMKFHPSVASTGTGTAVGGVPRDVQLLELLGKSAYTPNISGVDAVWADSSGNGYNATQSVHAYKPIASTTAANSLVHYQGVGTVVSASGFMTAIKATTAYSIVIKQSYGQFIDGRSFGHWSFTNEAYDTMVVGYSVTDPTADATLTPKQPSGYNIAASYFYRTAPAVVDVLDGSAHTIIYMTDAASSSFAVDGTVWAMNSGKMPLVPANATVFTPGANAGLGKVNYGNAYTDTYGVRVFSRLLTATEVTGSTAWTWQ